MSRAWNFSAGPAVLPEPVLRQAQDELLEWQGVGASVMEISHRSRPFIALAEEAEARLRSLMSIPPEYKVLFLQGGATLQFALLAMNLATRGQSADYVLSGHWSEKAAREASPYVRIRTAADASVSGYHQLPSFEQWQVGSDAAYVHYTPNETIQGLEYPDIPDLGELPLVADMSSCILSQPLEVRRFGLIYAGAQKNIGPSGLTVLIVREDLLERSRGHDMAMILRYSEHAAHASMLNTPNTWAWYLAGLTFAWLDRQGGVEVMGQRNRHKADLLYDAIDGSSDFYRNDVDVNSRSRMNVPFFLHDPKLNMRFLEQAEQRGLIGLKGHRALGGMRASLYNAMSVQGVEVLVEFMREFQQTNG